MSGAAKSPAKTPLLGPGRPLQVVQVSSAEGDEPIRLNEDALKELEDNLALVRQKHGDIPLTIHSAAGTFREGKSFILDCFLRYLYHLEISSVDDLVLENVVDSSFLENCNLTAPLPDGSEIFETRSSTDRVTAGIWLYSKPFVISTGNFIGSGGAISGQKVAVLLMDTQGLFDTAAMSSLDAPIFALSVLLSSKQIINKRGQFNTNDWQLLNLFTEFANEIVRKLHRGKDPELLGEKPFQQLEFLSRDFQNFDLEFDDIGTVNEHGHKVSLEHFLAHCEEASNEYLDRMTAQMRKHHQAVSDRIQSLYQNITCTCLSHPGEKMTSKRWQGDSVALSDTFRALVARYCRSSFVAPAIKYDVLGNQMEFGAFIQWIREFTTCMIAAVETGQLPNVDEVVKVVTQHQLHKLQEDAVEFMKSEFSKAGKDGKKHIPDSQLEVLVETVRSKCIKDFSAAAQFGPEEEIAASLDTLTKKLSDVEQAFRDRNKLAMTKILVFFAPLITLAIVLYVVDWISDWVCDAYLEECVTASSVMAFIYTAISISFIGYCAMLYKEYKPQGLWAAVGPLAGEVGAHFEKASARVTELVDKVKGRASASNAAPATAADTAPSNAAKASQNSAAGSGGGSAGASKKND